MINMMMSSQNGNDDTYVSTSAWWRNVEKVTVHNTCDINIINHLPHNSVPRRFSTRAIQSLAVLEFVIHIDR